MTKFRRFFRRLLFSGAALTGVLSLVNRSVEEHATEKNILDPDDGAFYEWKHCRVFYRRQGSGDTPLLLIHNASVFGSGHEFVSVIKALSARYTVYTLDLPGCGRSGKPALIYTNYFFSSMICAFIRDVIGKRAVAAASGLSGSFVVMASYASPELFEKIFLINPPSETQLERVPSHRTDTLTAMMSVPVIGKSVFYMITAKRNVLYILEKKYFLNADRILSRTADAFYEASHRGEGMGRYFLASLNGQYLNWNIRRALSELTVPVKILCSSSIANAVTAAEGLRKINPAISIRRVGRSGLLPQLERPEEFISILLNE